jgi:ERCC4-related helicase
LQDFIAPFLIFLEAKYKMVYEKVLEDFSETNIHLQSTAITVTPGGQKEKVKYKAVIDDNGIDKIWIYKRKIVREIRCIKEEL